MNRRGCSSSAQMMKAFHRRPGWHGDWHPTPQRVLAHPSRGGGAGGVDDPTSGFGTGWWHLSRPGVVEPINGSNGRCPNDLWQVDATRIATGR